MDKATVSEMAADDADFVFLEISLLRELLAGTLKPGVSDAALGFKYEQESAAPNSVGDKKIDRTPALSTNWTDFHREVWSRPNSIVKYGGD